MNKSEFEQEEKLLEKVSSKTEYERLYFKLGPQPRTYLRKGRELTLKEALDKYREFANPSKFRKWLGEQLKEKDNEL